jgi:hypothetical protein
MYQDPFLSLLWNRRTLASEARRAVHVAKPMLRNPNASHVNRQ